MNKPYVITHFLKELQDGFYIDINPDSDENSWTKVLDANYRWRGIAIVPTEMSFNRSPMFRPYVGNLDDDPKKLVDAIYETHPGTMIHYMRVNGVKNLKRLFDVTYEEDVEKPYAIQKVWPHLNFISIEVVGDCSPELVDQLYRQFDVKWQCKEGESNWFVNEVMSYLI